MIALYSRADGVAWEYPLDEFVSAIKRGEVMLAALGCSTRQTAFSLRRWLSTCDRSHQPRRWRNCR